MSANRMDEYTSSLVGGDPFLLFERESRGGRESKCPSRLRWMSRVKARILLLLAVRRGVGVDEVWTELGGVACSVHSIRATGSFPDRGRDCGERP